MGSDKLKYMKPPSCGMLAQSGKYLIEHGGCLQDFTGMSQRFSAVASELKPC